MWMCVCRLGQVSAGVSKPARERESVGKKLLVFQRCWVIELQKSNITPHRGSSSSFSGSMCGWMDGCDQNFLFTNSRGGNRSIGMRMDMDGVTKKQAPSHRSARFVNCFIRDIPEMFVSSTGCTKWLTDWLTFSPISGTIEYRAMTDRHCCGWLLEKSLCVSPCIIFSAGLNVLYVESTVHRWLISLLEG